MPLFKDSPARVIRAYLYTTNLVVPSPAAGADKVPWVGYLFLKRTQKTHDDAIFIENTTPISDGRDMISGEDFQHHGIMITVRTLDVERGYLRCKAIEAWLTEELGRTTVIINMGQPDERRYMIDNFHVSTPTTPIGVEEESERMRHTLNGLMTFTEIVT